MEFAQYPRAGLLLASLGAVFMRDAGTWPEPSR